MNFLRSSPPATPGPTRRYLRWGLLISCAALLLAAAAGVAGWLALRAYAPTFTRDRIQVALTDALGRPVRIGEVRLNPWLGRFTASDITVGSATEPDGPLLRVGRLQIRLGLSSLWQREVVISRIVLEDFALRIRPDGGGPLPHSLLLPQRVTLGPVTASLREIQFLRGTVVYDEPGATGLALQGLDGSVGLAADHLDVRLRAGALRVRAGRIDQAFTALEAEGRILADRIAIQRMRARRQGRPFQLSGEIRPLSRPLPLALALQGELDLTEAARVAGVTTTVSGVATIRADIGGTLEAPRLSGQAAIPALIVASTRARSVALRGRWERETLSLDQVRAEVFGGTVQGELTMTPSRPSDTRIRLAFRDLAAPALDALLPRPTGITGRLTGESDLQGDLRQPATLTGRFALEAAGVGLPAPYTRLGVGTLRAEGRLAGEALDLAQAAARWPGLEVAARGGVGLAGPRALALDGAIDLERAVSLWGRTGIAGRVQFALEAAGRWEQPDLTGRLRSDGLSLGGIRLDEAEMPIRLSGATVYAEPTLRLGRIRVAASGSATWPSPLPPDGWSPERDLRFRLQASAPQVAWEDLAAWLPEAGRGQGQLALSGTASGTVESWAGTVELRASSLTTSQGVPIRDIDARATLAPRQLEIVDLRARVQGIPLRARGSWAWDGDGELTADLGPSDLVHLPWQAAADLLQGTGTATVRARLQRGALEASGRASLRDVNLWDIPLGPGDAEASLSGGQLRARIGFPRARLGATVSGPLRRDGLLAAEIRLEQAAVEPLVWRFAPETDAPVTGTVTALAELAIPFADPATTRGTLSLDPVRLVVAGEEWANRGPIALRWTGAALMVERLEVAGRLGNLTVSGRYDPRGPLDFTARGRIPLAVLPTLRPEIQEASGTLTLTAQIGGTTADPALRADLTVQDGLFRLRDSAEPVRQVEARAAVTTGAVRLIEATATLGRARLQASGTLALVSGKPGPYRAAIKVENLDLNPLQGLRAVWNGDLEVAGTGLQPVVRGEGRLVRGTYTGDLSLLSLLLRDRPEKAASVGPAIPLRLALHLDDNLLVQANQSRLRVGGTLNLEGTSTAPVLFGRLVSRDGRVFFRKHRWTVVSASARFDDPSRISPVLDVTATARIRTYEVTMRLSGRLDELDLRFSSQPPLLEKQLLALITLGSPDLPSGGAGATALLGEAMQLLLQDLLGADTKSLGLGAIDIRTVEEKRETQLQFGAQLNEDARLVYSQSVSGSSKRTLRLEYQLLGPVFIAGEQDFGGHVGGDIFVRLRFR